MKKYMVKNTEYTDKFEVGAIVHVVPPEESELGLMMIMSGVDPFDPRINIYEDENGVQQILEVEHVEEVE